MSTETPQRGHFERRELDDARRGFLPLLVPVEGHAVVCQTCGALVLDNRNALSAHRDSHAGAQEWRPELGDVETPAVPYRREQP